MVRRFRLTKVVEVTAHALGREALAVERTHRPRLVTGITIHCRVRPDEGKAVLMLIDGVDGNLPPRIPMTEFALRAVLAAVNVSVAVLTLLSDIGKDEVGVAILAWDFGMQAPQRKTCLTMFKFRHSPNGGPTLGRVAVLTPDVQAAVRALRSRGHSPGATPWGAYR